MIELFHNQHVGLIDLPDDQSGSLAFHQRLPGYTPTPIAQVPQLAAALGLGKIWAKQESCRLGMPAFSACGTCASNS